MLRARFASVIVLVDDMFARAVSYAYYQGGRLDLKGYTWSEMYQCHSSCG